MSYAFFVGYSIVLILHKNLLLGNSNQKALLYNWMFLFTRKINVFIWIIILLIEKSLLPQNNVIKNGIVDFGLIINGVR